MHTPAQSAKPTPSAPPGWSRSYELKAVALLSAGSGLVGLDRFIINPLFPVMSKDLGLNYQDLGLISAILALCWGLSSVFTGQLSDRIGRKRVIVPSVLIFSLLVATSGLAAGLISLLVIRALMGFAEGAYVPAAIVATVEASRPSRIGLNVGLQMMASPLVGLGLGPIIAVGLLSVLPSWHWVFAVVAGPGLLVTWLLHRVLRADSPSAQKAAASAEGKPGLREVLQQPAVWVNTFCMVCWLSCLVVLSAFMPNYLTDQLKLGLGDMSLVLAGLGAGSCLGMVLVPWLSDKVGRKPVLSAAPLLVIPALIVLPGIGADKTQLFALLFVIMFMIAGAVSITVGPLTNEAVPARLATSATGVVVGVGEVVGGALAPALAGWAAQRYGIAIVLDIALYSAAAGLLMVVFGVAGRREKKSLRLA